MQVSILAGCIADEEANFDASYPINLEPVVSDNGVSKGYLHTAPGITEITNLGPGITSRGAITWNGLCYRVHGVSFQRYNGNVGTTLGAVTAGGPVTMDYSFDLLAIAAGGNLFYWDGATLTQVADPDLGTVLDVCWIDGYFMTTDGTYLVVTELSDPYSVNPLKYGSSEADPDPILAVKKVRNEAYAVNRYTIENFQNVGGSGFPFRRNPGGLIPKGAAGTHAIDYFLDTLGFVGSGRNEALSVYIAGAGDVTCISTPEIDAMLAALSDAEQAALEVEALVEEGEQRLLIHLPDKTLVYSHQATLAAKAMVWSIRAGGALGDEIYPARHFALAEGRWVCGSPVDGAVGVLDPSVETYFGDVAGWQFDTAFLYNGGRGGILKSAELVGLPGRAPVGVTPTAFMSWTQDGVTWSVERAVSTGNIAQRRKRMQWRPKTRFGNYMGLRFRGSSTALNGFARLEVEVEPLNA